MFLLLFSFFLFCLSLFLLILNIILYQRNKLASQKLYLDKFKLRKIRSIRTADTITYEIDLDHDYVQFYSQYQLTLILSLLKKYYQSALNYQFKIIIHIQENNNIVSIIVKPLLELGFKVQNISEHYCYPQHYDLVFDNTK